MKKFGLIICLLALLLFGCVEPIVLDPGEGFAGHGVLRFEEQYHI